MCGWTTVLMLLLRSASAQAQVEWLGVVIPTEFSVGLGGVIDQPSRQSSLAVNFGLSRPPSLGSKFRRDQWVEPAFEGGFGPTSDEAPCQDGGPLARPETCFDAYAVIGPRFRPLRESDRLWRPFIHFLVGGYWKGTGLKEPEFLPSDFTLQIGGGVDLRRPASIHGLRLSTDYRRVFADRGRQQLQLLVSYFVGWRGKPD
ncbi:MAG: hypothetical protein A3H97_11430 [Acidobacteria bacterium RIFCSPLOWO2_02_FULL_65_29]|nr:MAG: hypothetical protein A3H97_11430 [Acidobacteria bacterium RIFCSPLOWO2_02_FULL_65_29]